MRRKFSRRAVCPILAVAALTAVTGVAVGQCRTHQRATSGTGYDGLAIVVIDMANDGLTPPADHQQGLSGGSRQGVREAVPKI